MRCALFDLSLAFAYIKGKDINSDLIIIYESSMSGLGKRRIEIAFQNDV